jgi:DNA adenine methylase
MYNHIYKLDSRNAKKIILERIDAINGHLCDVDFTNVDFRRVLVGMYARWTEDQCKSTRSFIYADPPYVGAGNEKLYENTGKWLLSDTEDLFNILVSSGCRFAISEFDSPVILELAEHHNLQVTITGERRNLNNRRTEILITNYDTAAASRKDKELF